MNPASIRLLSRQLAAPQFSKPEDVGVRFFAQDHGDGNPDGEMVRYRKYRGR